MSFSHRFTAHLKAITDEFYMELGKKEHQTNDDDLWQRPIAYCPALPCQALAASFQGTT